MEILDELFKIFSTREFAVIFWVFVLFIVFMCVQSLRHSLIGIIRTLCALLVPMFILFFYVAIEVIILEHLCLWNIGLLKDTIIWTLFSAIAIFFKSIENSDISFKDIIKDNIKVMLIFQFIINLHTFNLTVELISLPIITFTSLLYAHSSYDNNKTKNKKVRSCLLGILNAYALSIFIYSIYKTILDYDTLSLSTLKAFLLPIILFVLTLPFFYFFALYAKYEVLFITINNFSSERYKNKYLKFWVIFYANISFAKIKRIRSRISLVPDSCNGKLRKYIKIMVSPPKHLKAPIDSEMKIILFNDIKATFALLSTIGMDGFDEWNNPMFDDEFSSSSRIIQLSQKTFGATNNMYCFFAGKETCIVSLKFRINICNLQDRQIAILEYKNMLKEILDILNVKVSTELLKAISNKRNYAFENDIYILEFKYEVYKKIEYGSLSLESK